MFGLFKKKYNFSSKEEELKHHLEVEIDEKIKSDFKKSNLKDSALAGFIIKETIQQCYRNNINQKPKLAMRYKLTLEEVEICIIDVCMKLDEKYLEN